MKVSFALSYVREQGLRKALRRGAKFALKKYNYELVKRGSDSEQLLVLPLAVECVVNDIGLENFQFIQIGANDGVRYDPLHYVVKKLSLKGLLVEPLPDMYQDLMANYDELSGLRFANVAIANEPGDLTLYRIRREANVGDWFHGVATTSERKLVRQTKRYGLNPNEVIEKVVVPTMTFHQLLDKYQISAYNLLQIDTEGYDFKILQMALAEGIYPEIINFEHVMLDPDEKRQAQALLKESGYQYLAIRDDTIAMRC